MVMKFFFKYSFCCNKKPFERVTNNRQKRQEWVSYIYYRRNFFSAQKPFHQIKDITEDSFFYETLSVAVCRCTPIFYVPWCVIFFYLDTCYIYSSKLFFREREYLVFFGLPWDIQYMNSFFQEPGVTNECWNWTWTRNS